MQYSLKTVYLIFALITILISCESPDKQSLDTKTQKTPPLVSANTKKESRTILIQPFSDLPISKADYVLENLRKIYPNTKLLQAISLPSKTFYKPRNRYRADSLIHWLKGRISDKQVVVGITSKDISTTKGDNPDHGVMGLGFLDGPSCMVSIFRLKKGSDDQLFKTVVHELGHNFALDHCPIKTCFMRDAKGRNPIDEEIEFCPSCKKVLLNAGWIL